MVVAGLHNGNVAVYNLHKNTGAPSHISNAQNGKHRDIVWEVGYTVIKIRRDCNFDFEYQPSGAGGTRSPPATSHRLQYLPARFIQNCRWGPGIGKTLGYWTL